jgi:carboxyl-terminal processing protease
VLNAALFPSSAGTYSFVFSRAGSANLTRTFTAAAITKTPVLVTQVITAGDGQKVGYIVFNDHIVPAEQQLINAVNSLRSQGVSDLVLDLRYNGGGYIFIASELAYMIAGQSRTQGLVFEKFQYNNKRTADNAAPGTPFYSTSCILNANFQCTNQQPLPSLNLTRVYVLTSGGTCSASESVINGLRGIDVQVNIVGTTTCGKPYGFTAEDNCGISYFPIEFKGVNAKGFGDYADGFAATCTAGDDLGRPLGDVNEAKLATALYMRANGNACPPVPLGLGKQAQAAFKQGQPVSDGNVLRGPQRESRIHLPLPR